MKLALRGLILALIVFAFLVNQVSALETKGPKIVIKELTHDFKDIKEGEDLDHTFLVLNQGDQTLEIKEVKPG